MPATLQAAAVYFQHMQAVCHHHRYVDEVRLRLRGTQESSSQVMPPGARLAQRSAGPAAGAWPAVDQRHCWYMRRAVRMAPGQLAG